jgi:sterol desaturase/sphingolipid hydroxylase (fatty acid hydroxylase superfamily)
MFANPWLEWLSRVHPATPFVLYLPVVAALLLWPGSAAHGAWFRLLPFGAGLLLWTLLEYLLHRFVFHFTGADGRPPRWQFHVHGVHHEFPGDRDRLVMPPAASVPAAILVFVGARLALPGAVALPLVAGVVTGYLAYDFLHWRAHAGRSTHWLARAHRRYHLQHHFLDSGAHFGVSTPLWDHVFGTTQLRRRTAVGAQERGGGRSPGTDTGPSREEVTTS